LFGRGTAIFFIGIDQGTHSRSIFAVQVRSDLARRGPGGLLRGFAVAPLRRRVVTHSRATSPPSQLDTVLRIVATPPRDP
jgi:hypothetical protein